MKWPSCTVLVARTYILVISLNSLDASLNPVAICNFREHMYLSIVSHCGLVTSWEALILLKYVTGLKWTAFARRKYRDLRNLLIDAWNQILFKLLLNGMSLFACFLLVSVESASKSISTCLLIRVKQWHSVGVETCLNGCNINCKEHIYSFL